MANAVTMQQLINASLDTDALETAINGADNQDVQTRLNKKYPTLAKAIKLMLQNSIFEAKPFSILSELVADKTLANGSFAFVYNDSDGNNGLYYKANGQWIKSTLSPISFDYETINILDTSGVEADKYVDFSDGKIGAVTGFAVTKFIRIKPNTVYKTSEFYNQQFAFYDASLNYISGLASVDSNKEFLTPANAFYARFTVESEWLDILVIAEKDKFPVSYVPYHPVKIINDLKIRPEQIIDFLASIKSALNFETINLIDPAKVTDGKYVDFSDGKIWAVTGFAVTDFVLIKPNVVYKTSDFYSQQFAFYDSEFKYISGLAQPNQNHEFTTPANAKYARFTVDMDWFDSLVIAEKRLFPDGYVAPNKYIIDDLYLPKENKKTNIIWVSADTSDTDTQVKFKGKNAVQLALDSITDATDKKRYIIKTKGLYKVNVASKVIGYPGYPSMILAKDHVDIIGDGKTVFWCELPFNDADIGPSANGTTYSRTTYQTLYSYAKDCLIKDVTFVIVNGRYALHLDNPNGANSTHKFENVFFVSKGSKGSMQALGCGTSTGEETYFIGGGAHSDGGTPFYCHNNSKFSTPSKMYFEGFKFSSNTSKLIVRCENDGSLVDDKMQMVGCSWGGTSYVMEYGQLWLKSNPSQNYDSFNHAEWKFSGYGNDPFLFDNQVAGYCLRIKTTATGLNNSIRFDKSSSAYSLLIQNNQANTDVNLYTNSRDYIDGYIVQDGSVELSGQAWGCKDLTETASYADSGVVYTSLGKRLGDCSTSNKSLGVIINGIPNTVTFNKDYRSMTNAQIIAEINTQLSGASADLYVYGRDYYAEMTDVTETVYNTGSTFIRKGSVVSKSLGSVRLAQEGDKIYGVALDDIPVQQTTAEGMKKGEGRVLKRGYIYTNQNKAHYVLADNQAPAIGTKFNVLNGQLVTDSNGKISVDIDTGIVSINC